MNMFEVLADPFNKVVLEDTLNELVKEIGCDCFVYIRPGEV